MPLSEGPVAVGLRLGSSAPIAGVLCGLQIHPRFPLKGSFKGDTDIDVDIEI